MKVRSQLGIHASVGSTLSRNRIASAAALAVLGIGLATSHASGSAIILSSGTNTGGMSLTPANVLLAAAPYISSSTVLPIGNLQGVTFQSMTVSAGTDAATNLSTGVSAVLSASNGLNANGAAADQGFLYCSSGSTTVSPQPSDSSSAYLTALLNQGNDSAHQGGQTVTTMTLTISGLTTGQQYSIDLPSNVGSPTNSGRTQGISINGGSFLDSLSLITVSNGVNSYTNGYDTNEIATAGTGTAPTGEIIVSLICTTTSQTPVFNGVIVSSVSTPEPVSLGMLAVGAVGLLGRRRRAAPGKS